MGFFRVLSSMAEVELQLLGFYSLREPRLLAFAPAIVASALGEKGACLRWLVFGGGSGLCCGVELAMPALVVQRCSVQHMQCKAAYRAGALCNDHFNNPLICVSLPADDSHNRDEVAL